MSLAGDLMYGLLTSLSYTKHFGFLFLGFKVYCEPHDYYRLER